MSSSQIPSQNEEESRGKSQSPSSADSALRDEPELPSRSSTSPTALKHLEDDKALPELTAIGAQEVRDSAFQQHGFSSRPPRPAILKRDPRQAKPQLRENESASPTKASNHQIPHMGSDAHVAEDNESSSSIVHDGGYFFDINIVRVTGRGQREQHPIRLSLDRNEAQAVQSYLIADRESASQNASGAPSNVQHVEVEINSRRRFTFSRNPTDEELRPAFAAVTLAYENSKVARQEMAEQNNLLQQELEVVKREFDEQKKSNAELNRTARHFYDKMEAREKDFTASLTEREEKHRKLNDSFHRALSEMSKLKKDLAEANDRVASLEEQYASDENLWRQRLFRAHRDVELRQKRIETAEVQIENAKVQIEDLNASLDKTTQDAESKEQLQKSELLELFNQRNHLLRQQSAVQAFLDDAMSHQLAARTEFENTVAAFSSFASPKSKIPSPEGARTPLDKPVGETTNTKNNVLSAPNASVPEADVAGILWPSYIQRAAEDDLNNQNFLGEGNSVHGRELKHDKRKARPANISTSLPSKLPKIDRDKPSENRTANVIDQVYPTIFSTTSQTRIAWDNPYLSPRMLQQQVELYQDQLFRKWPIDFLWNAEMLCDFNAPNSGGDDCVFSKGDHIQVAVVDRVWWPTRHIGKLDEEEFCLVPQNCIALTCIHFEKYNEYYQAHEDYVAQQDEEISLTKGQYLEVSHRIFHPATNEFFCCANILSNDTQTHGRVPESCLTKLDETGYTLPLPRFCPCENGEAYLGSARVLQTYHSVDDDNDFWVEVHALVKVAHLDENFTRACVLEPMSRRQGFVPLTHLEIDEKPFLIEPETPNFLSPCPTAREFPRHQDLSMITTSQHNIRKWNPWERGVPDEGPCYIDRKAARHLPKPLKDTLTFNSRQPNRGKKRPRARSLSFIGYGAEGSVDIANDIQSEPDIKEYQYVKRKYVYDNANGGLEYAEDTDSGEQSILKSSIWESHHPWSPNFTYSKAALHGNPDEYADIDFPWGTRYEFMAEKWPRPSSNVEEAKHQLKNDFDLMLEGDFAYRRKWNWQYRKNDETRYFPVRFLTRDFWQAYQKNHRRAIANYPLGTKTKCDVYKGHYVKILESSDRQGFVKVQRPVDLSIIEIPDKYFRNREVGRLIHDDYKEWSHDMFVEVTAECISPANGITLHEGDFLKLVYMNPFTLDSDHSEILVEECWQSNTSGFKQNKTRGFVPAKCLHPIPRLRTARLIEPVQTSNDRDLQSGVWPIDTVVIITSLPANNERVNCLNGPVEQCIFSESLFMLPPNEWMTIDDYYDSLSMSSPAKPAQSFRTQDHDQNNDANEELVHAEPANRTGKPYLLESESIDNYDWAFKNWDESSTEPEPSSSQSQSLHIRVHDLETEHKGELWCRNASGQCLMLVETSLLDLKNPYLPMCRLKPELQLLTASEKQEVTSSENDSDAMWVIVLSSTSKQSQVFCLAENKEARWHDVTRMDLDHTGYVRVRTLIERGLFNHTLKEVEEAIGRLSGRSYDITETSSQRSYTSEPPVIGNQLSEPELDFQEQNSRTFDNLDTATHNEQPVASQTDVKDVQSSEMNSKSSKLSPTSNAILNSRTKNLKRATNVRRPPYLQGTSPPTSKGSNKVPFLPKPIKLASQQNVPQFETQSADQGHRGTEGPPDEAKTSKAVQLLDFLLYPASRVGGSSLSLPDIISTYKDRTGSWIGKEYLPSSSDIQNLPQADLLQLTGQLTVDHIAYAFGRTDLGLIVSLRDLQLQKDREHQKFTYADLIVARTATTLSSIVIIVLVTVHRSFLISYYYFEHSILATALEMAAAQQGLHRVTCIASRWVDERFYLLVHRIGLTIRAVRNGAVQTHRMFLWSIQRRMTTCSTMVTSISDHLITRLKLNKQLFFPNSISLSNILSSRLSLPLAHANHRTLRLQSFRLPPSLLLTILYWTILALLFAEVLASRRTWVNANFYNGHSTAYGLVQARMDDMKNQQYYSYMSWGWDGPVKDMLRWKVATYFRDSLDGGRLTYCC